MNLEDFERRGGKDHARFVTQVRDVSGDEAYELTLTFGSVLPRSGDQDLFLHLFGATGPVVSASALPLTLLDAVSFVLPPPFPFVPVFRIFGFTTGVCGNFTAFGA